MRRAAWKIGTKVQVPYYCFAPHRAGWNGWLFVDGVIVARCVGVGKFEGVKYARVKYVANGKEVVRQYRMENVFAQ